MTLVLEKSATLQLSPLPTLHHPHSLLNPTRSLTSRLVQTKAILRYPMAILSTLAFVRREMRVKDLRYLVVVEFRGAREGTSRLRLRRDREGASSRPRLAMLRRVRWALWVRKRRRRRWNGLKRVRRMLSTFHRHRRSCRCRLGRLRMLQSWIPRDLSISTSHLLSPQLRAVRINEQCLPFHYDALKTSKTRTSSTYLLPPVDDPPPTDPNRPLPLLLPHSEKPISLSKTSS